MTRPHVRSIVCAVMVIACIGGGILVHAAGPVGFVSRIWKERPVILKTKESRLNPMNWFRRTEGEDSDATEPSDGQVSERSELTSDPFLVEESLGAEGVTSDAEAARALAALTGDSPANVQTTGATSQGPGDIRTQTQPATRSTQPGPVETNFGRSETATRNTAQAAPRLPELGGFGPATPSAEVANRSEPVAARPVTSRPAPQTRTQQAQRPSGNGNQFVGGFDAEFEKLVRSVIAETDTVQAPMPRLPDTGSTASSSESAPLLTSQSPSDDLYVPRLPEQPGLSHVAADESIGAASGFSMQSERADFARYASQLAGRPVREVIETSRQKIDSTPLATMRNSVREQLTAGEQAAGRVQPIDATAARLPAEPRLEMLNETTMQIIPGASGSGIIIEAPHSTPVRPRVTSNTAPRRSVPDNSEFERLSYQTDIGENGLGEDAAADGPLLLLPDDPQHAGQQFLEKDEHEHGHEHAASAPTTAPAFKGGWPNSSDMEAEEAGSGYGWAIAVICLILAVAAGGYAARRKWQTSSFDLTRIRPRFEKD